jgi:hypothetical protein
LWIATQLSGTVQVPARLLRATKAKGLVLTQGAPMPRDALRQAALMAGG